MEDLKIAFFRVYSNVPLGVREEVVIVIDDAALSWNATYYEVLANSPVSERILMELRELAII